MIETIVGWLAGKAVKALGERVGAVLGNPLVIEAVLVTGVLAGVYWLASHNGRAACEAEHQHQIIEQQAATIAATGAALVKAQEGAAVLAADLAALHKGAGKARKELEDALPPAASDHACDYPGGPTRRMLNESSGWPD